jgi:hypothetical protein
MNFAELMSLISFTTPLFCSLGAGWKEGRGFGILIGLVVGLVFSVGSFFGTRMLFKWVIRHPKLGKTHPGFFWIGLSWFLCVALAAWIFGFTFLGMWLTKFVIHGITT